MKKTLIAVAALSAMAASAMAADVTLYGVLDYSVNATSVKATGAERDNTVSMDSGNKAGARWGIKGTEDLGNGYKVGFVLESGISNDTGKTTSGQVFNRQSELNVTTPYGKVAFGRMGTITNGTNGGVMLSYASPFGTSSYGATASATKIFNSKDSRLNNAIRYDSPVFAGFQAIAQYSDAMDTEDANGHRHSQDQFAALILQYKNGPLTVAVSADEHKLKDTAAVKATYGKKLDGTKYVDDTTLMLTAPVDAKKGDTYRTYDAAVNYDFGVAKVFAFYQYDSNYNSGYQLGVSAPVCGGTVMAQVGFKDAYAEDSDAYRATLAYVYKLSKRTQVYAAAGYMKEETGAKTNTKTSNVVLGVQHNF